MFVITINDEKLFVNLQENHKAYPDSAYDFTFDHRFLICHREVKHPSGCPAYEYIAVDKTTGYGSVVCTKKTLVRPFEYHKMSNEILYSIKYTGDARYLQKTNGGF